MTPAQAAHIYFLRRNEGQRAPGTEHAVCCDLVHPRALTNHQRGFQHVALVTCTPYRLLRREVDRLYTVRAVEAHLRRVRS